MKANILQELVAKWRREVARHEASEASRNDECATCAALTFEECAYELQAALDAQAGGWLPIESAPRDGTGFLAWECGGYCIRYRGEDYPDDAACDEMGTACYPTHWMPLPAGPVEGGGK